MTRIRAVGELRAFMKDIPDDARVDGRVSASERTWFLDVDVETLPGFSYSTSPLIFRLSHADLKRLPELHTVEDIAELLRLNGDVPLPVIFRRLTESIEKVQVAEQFANKEYNRAEEQRREASRLRDALDDIADRLILGGEHDQWARRQQEPCTCVMHVAHHALGRP